MLPITQEEINETFEQLEQQGWKPMLCDRIIPHYDNEVMCGNPNMVGDLIQEYQMIPTAAFGQAVLYSVFAKGDSMIGAGIHSGDRLTIRTDCDFRNGDIILVRINGEFFIKTYWEDENGDKWLLPCNDQYEPRLLTEEDDVYFNGRVVEISRREPSVNYRECRNILRRAKEAASENNTIEKERWEEVIRTISVDITYKRLWFSVYRQYATYKIMAKGDYDTFCKEVARLVPKHEHLPTPTELQRLDTQSFSKPVALWDINDAPVRGKRFYVYRNIAIKTGELLST